MKKVIRFLLILLCLSGIALSGVSLYNHYAVAATEYCDLGQTFNCDIVNRSRYSVFLGIPVALIGLCGYAALLGLTLARDRWASFLRFSLSAVALGFSVYLTWVEAKVLGTFCILCLGSLVAIAGIVVLAAVELGWPQGPVSVPSQSERA